MNHVWVIEEKEDGQWWPAEIALTRDIGRWKLNRWKERNPSYTFRLKKYVRAD